MWRLRTSEEKQNLMNTGNKDMGLDLKKTSGWRTPSEEGRRVDQIPNGIRRWPARQRSSNLKRCKKYPTGIHGAEGPREKLF